MNNRRKESIRNRLRIIILGVEGALIILLTFMILDAAEIIKRGGNAVAGQSFQNVLPGSQVGEGLSGNVDWENAFVENLGRVIGKEVDSMLMDAEGELLRLKRESIPADAIIYGGHSYYLFDNDCKDWDDVLSYCKSRGGYPAVINDHDENEVLYNYMLAMNRGATFIGYTDRETEGVWKWVEGHHSDFTDWGMNDEGQKEPNSAQRTEDYAQLDVHMLKGHWNDCTFGQDTSSFICEWDISRN